VELADTSAWTVRRRDPDLNRRFLERMADGVIATCPMVMMELLWTARDADELAIMRVGLEALPQIPIHEPVWRRAIEVLELLAGDGPLHHRRVTPPDLLIAAAAERAGVAVLHYDRAFELIADTTGQSVRSIAPLGSL